MKPVYSLIIFTVLIIATSTAGHAAEALSAGKQSVIPQSGGGENEMALNTGSAATHEYTPYAVVVLENEDTGVVRQLTYSQSSGVLQAEAIERPDGSSVFTIYSPEGNPELRITTYEGDYAYEERFDENGTVVSTYSGIISSGGLLQWEENPDQPQAMPTLEATGVPEE